MGYRPRRAGLWGTTGRAEGLNNSLAATGRTAAGIAAATDALTPSLGRSSNAAEDLGRALRQAQQTASSALGGRSGRAGSDEVLRYLRDLKTAEADLDRLKAAREIRTRRLRPGDLRRILGVSPRRAQEVFCWACGTGPNLGIESTLRLAEGLGIQPRLVLEKRAA